MPAEAYARTVMQQIEILATISEEPDRLTRRFATLAMQQANETVAEWMRSAGMFVRQDKIGNLIGRYDAVGAGAKTLLLGSHLDTVCDAGKYDGPLGILVALAVIQQLHTENKHLPFAIEVIAFADEEGLRYGISYLGSKVVAGTFDPDYLCLTDADGTIMDEAIRAFGGDPDALHTSEWQGDDLLGYCEVHIEQGSVLEAQDLPVGVVSAIAGQSRFTVNFEGEAGHAGTVLMGQRRDALCAAAEFVLRVESLAQKERELVATVGQIEVQPGASNVIPGSVMLSLDVRHQNDVLREQACHQLHAEAMAICTARQITLGWQLLQESRSVPCAPELAGLLAKAIEELGYPAHQLPSGAGHDAVAVADLAPVAMLFVRCQAGISHHPAESVTMGDVAVAIEVLGRFLGLLAGD